MAPITVVAIALLVLAGALLSLRLRRRGREICAGLAGLDDAGLAGLGPEELARIDEDLHDCARQCRPAEAAAIGPARQRIEALLAGSGSSPATDPSEPPRHPTPAQRRESRAQRRARPSRS